ncbi:TRAP-type C4-dicarboxylate transport system, large permease component [Brachybacterium faecium]|uniref:TRAP transporter, DctM subunit n=1 Tax=Brachybacterium faecium (strain ATCC 43885 / DSM 4810 / JCM 11609 / LMG 19847 / NBRC 14762 / NCIMB 9860 / 6-10) TaxID=446465 RepID=C7M9S9_BRAFD|nr:TRAP transporter large permease [Brachybacterium faecium]ACU84623.1 TRAP transporter, DctM subunit [Brachybacterium faecium DSM 4810]SLN04955.1 TRAP-type C4-dicarboxylate transport system, large permease component [Brachybacterium faecium]
MDPALLAGVILIAGVIVLIGIGAPIGIAIGMPSILALAAVVGTEQAVFVASQRMFTGASSFTLLAIPFFVLAGSLMNTGGIASRLVDAAKVLVGRMPGSLAQTNVVANAMFSSVSGAAVASAAAMGSTLGPRMRREGYDPNVSAAVNAASAPAGMMIPPSNTLIVYSLVSSTSVATLFMAGYGPGLVWVLACVAVVAIYSRRRPEMRASGDRVPLGLALVTLAKALPAVLMIVVVIGGLLAGLFTATESAVIAVAYSLILGLIYRQLTLKNLPTVIADSARTTAVVMLLVAVSSALSWVLSYATIPQTISAGLLGLAESKTLILLLMMLILLIVGAFMDPTPAILIFTPIFLPIATELGVDPIHFGLMITFNLSLGTITPPVGNILFISAKVGGVRVEPVIKAMIPFFIALLIGLLVVVFIPQISLFLPEALGMMTGVEG